MCTLLQLDLLNGFNFKQSCRQHHDAIALLFNIVVYGDRRNWRTKKKSHLDLNYLHCTLNDDESHVRYS